MYWFVTRFTAWYSTFLAANEIWCISGMRRIVNQDWRWSWAWFVVSSIKYLTVVTSVPQCKAESIIHNFTSDLSCYPVPGRTWPRHNLINMSRSISLIEQWAVGEVVVEVCPSYNVTWTESHGVQACLAWWNSLK